MATLRLLSVALTVVALGALTAAGGLAQNEPKKDGKDKDREKQIKDNIKKVNPVEETFQTCDGVKLRGVFYDAIAPKTPPAKAPVILMLHAYNQNPDEAVWDDTAKLAAAAGYHVFRFDFRGHGKSKDIVGRDFWDPRMPWYPINKSYIKGSDKAATKVTIDVKEFNPKYYGMLVNDIAAARAHLDKKNDAGQLNGSSVYLLAAGDAVNLGMLFTASEWKRERKRPNADLINLTVSPRRELFTGFDPAGPDIRGAIWLGPLPAPNGSGIGNDDIKRWVMSDYALDLRMETQMLFLYGKQDERAKNMTNTLFDHVLKILDMRDPKNKDKKLSGGPNGKSLPNPDQSFKQAIEGKNNGAKMLGNDNGTERFISLFIDRVEEDRKNRERTPNRNWDKPLYIDVGPSGFGAVK
jgi:pimeloyl-ACP methyl ester carboxylesterase